MEEKTDIKSLTLEELKSCFKELPEKSSMERVPVPSLP
jgi:hypothetical protein